MMAAPVSTRPNAAAAARNHEGWVTANLINQPKNGSTRLRWNAQPAAKLIKPRLDNPVADGQLRKTVVRIEEADTFASARALHKTFPREKIAVLNMANASTPGGGYMGGGRAQEEDLCHCSTLFSTLRPSLYPMQADELIYSPNVLVVKEKTNAGHRFLNHTEYFSVDVISCAAVARPRVVTDVDTGEVTYRGEADRALMANKINWIVNAAVRHGVNRLILGAFGCGVFGNPPGEVARLMKAMLLGAEDDNAPPTNWASHGLMEIVIAIYDPARGKPNLNGFIDEWKENPLAYGSDEEEVPQPEILQYTTFPANYRGLANDEFADDSLFNSPGLSRLV